MRSEMLKFRISPWELAKVKDAADERGLSVSDWLRDRLGLGHPPRLWVLIEGMWSEIKDHGDGTYTPVGGARRGWVSGDKWARAGTPAEAEQKAQMY